MDSPVSSDSSTCRSCADRQDRIGRHPVALGEEDDVAAHDLAAGDALAITVADDQGARAGQVAQASSTRSVRVSWISVIDTEVVANTSRTRASLKFPNSEVDRGGAKQQREHRLAQHVGENAQGAAAVPAPGVR